jgi:hypothetical protein
MHDGWEGVLARTWPSDDGARAAAAAGVNACRPGTRISEVMEAGVTVDGVGMGHEAVRAEDPLTTGMVLFVEATRDGARWGETVLVTDETPELLTSTVV